MKTPQEYGYVVKNNLCLFQKGPLSQWWGGFAGQKGGFSVPYLDLFVDHLVGDTICISTAMWKQTRKTYLFNCCEQWMMAWKAIAFCDLAALNAIMREKDPSKHKAIGRTIKNFDPYIWDSIKYNIVFKGNELKFSLHNNPELRDFIKQFHKATVFAEASPWDKVWGIGLGPDSADALDIYKWKGENLLGEALSQVRKDIP